MLRRDFIRMPAPQWESVYNEEPTCRFCYEEDEAACDCPALWRCKHTFRWKTNPKEGLDIVRRVDFFPGIAIRTWLSTYLNFGRAKITYRKSPYPSIRFLHFCCFRNQLNLACRPIYRSTAKDTIQIICWTQHISQVFALSVTIIDLNIYGCALYSIP